jgi:hypothetical protein
MSAIFDTVLRPVAIPERIASGSCKRLQKRLESGGLESVRSGHAHNRFAGRPNIPAGLRTGAFAQSGVTIADDGAVRTCAHRTALIFPTARQGLRRESVKHVTQSCSQTAAYRPLMGHLARQREVSLPIAMTRRLLCAPRAPAEEGVAAHNAIACDQSARRRFSGCWPGWAELESIPMASAWRIRVEPDYPGAEAPARRPVTSRRPTASYSSIVPRTSIYGCPQGMLTGMAVAWFREAFSPGPARSAFVPD